MRSQAGITLRDKQSGEGIPGISRHEPALGWTYTDFLQTLVENPGITPADLSKLVMQSYIVDDQRIVDERARADFLRQGSHLSALFSPSSMSAQELANQMGREITLSAIDLTQIPALMQSLNDLAYQMQHVDQSGIASARNYAQSFTSIFGRKSLTHNPTFLQVF